MPFMLVSITIGVISQTYQFSIIEPVAVDILITAHFTHKEYGFPISAPRKTADKSLG